MEALSVYHDSINKEMGEKILCKTNKDGSYLIRKSETRTGVYCLCVLFKGFVYTYRVHQTKDSLWVAETAPGVQERVFRNVKNLIAHFREPDKGIVIPLLYPVPAK
ncbi:SH2 domain-containing protein 1A-like [Brienomyrus brachyistius]|uniref:SH2 domain-containing protein 1A-like n=1 Tax=Brienomyrus brachyistius TaxID=42636 RepID=UPI0020B1EDF3|nr:SH2 domain-containing protein 1A-like [Brienomyrus brachyistius]XP_048883238.1 SH2 domain-containing protein 1A-like [Brienomyrus brachyistius]